MRKIADAIRDNFCSFFETEVASMFIRFSILTCVRSPGEDCGAGCDRELCPHAASHPSRRSKTVAPVIRTRSHLFDCLLRMANTPPLPPGAIRTQLASVMDVLVRHLFCNQYFRVL